jgi:three-Cys-motif partner protein
MARKATPIDLRSTPNEKCFGNCNKEARKKNSESDLCTVTSSVLDGLPVRCVGSWAYTKIFILNKYFDIFANGMKNKWGGNINYVELCSGPGRCVFRDTKEEVDGTALSILNHPSKKLLQSAIFIDYNKTVVDTLNKRIKELECGKKFCAIEGDYTDFPKMNKLFAELYSKVRGLYLVLIDPTDCSLPFETVKIIKKQLKKADLIINYAHNSDMGRNIRKAILEPDTPAHKKYSDFLGDNEFLKLPETIEMAEKKDTKALRTYYMEKYISQLKSIGYFIGKPKPVKNGGNILYYLLFVTGDDRGIDFWEKVNITDELGQISFL